MDEYVPGAGDIEIELIGSDKTEYKDWLKPSLAACIGLSRNSLGEPRQLADLCLQLNFDAICAVVALGTGQPNDESMQRLVFNTGTIKLFGQCVRFIHTISNGGRPPKTLEDMIAPDPLPTS